MRVIARLMGAGSEGDMAWLIGAGSEGDDVVDGCMT